MESAQFADFSPRYEAGGWVHWPEYLTHSTELMRLLGDAQEGASCVSECLLVANKVSPENAESWYLEWTVLADRLKREGTIAGVRGRVVTAKSNWLRAINYYRTSAAFLDSSDSRQLETSELVEHCAKRYLELIEPIGEKVEIPFEEGILHCYFVRATAIGRRPAIVCFGPLDESKEDQLIKFQLHAVSRGLSLLLVDLPGQGETLRLGGLSARHDQEFPIARCIDYLSDRDDVDHERIAVFGDGLGGTFASRAAAYDSRIAAAVCDGGFWEDREIQYFANRLQSCMIGRSRAPRYQMSGRIDCPYLIAVGEHDYADVKDWERLYRYSKRRGAKIDLKIFSNEETGSSHRQMDNPTIGRHFIFDWLNAQLATSMYT
jgi:dienelactone hydrolase